MGTGGQLEGDLQALALLDAVGPQREGKRLLCPGAGAKQDGRHKGEKNKLLHNHLRY